MTKAPYALAFMALCGVILVVHEMHAPESLKESEDPFLAAVEKVTRRFSQNRSLVPADPHTGWPHIAWGHGPLVHQIISAHPPCQWRSPTDLSPPLPAFLTWIIVRQHVVATAQRRLSKVFAEEASQKHISEVRATYSPKSSLGTRL